MQGHDVCLDDIAQVSRYFDVLKGWQGEDDGWRGGGDVNLKCDSCGWKRHHTSLAVDLLPE